MRVFRPWGHIDWLLDRLPPRQWSVAACCGTEDRSVALPEYFGRAAFQHVDIVSIRDPDPLEPSLHQERIEQRCSSLREHGYRDREIQHLGLLDAVDVRVSTVDRLIDVGADAIIVDITSLPKSWFFPIMQSVMQTQQFKDVIVTYTSATQYSLTLTENLMPLRMLPGFYAEDGRSKHESIIVGIGFEASGVVRVIKEQASGKLRLIFPFPPGPPGHIRNWMFVKEIEDLMKDNELHVPDIVHIDMYDCPQVFDALCEMTNNGNDEAAIAPYGPKTVSIAMCLFALGAITSGLPRVPVYYMQPRRYDIDYTSGVRMCGGVPEITGYCLRLDGRDLYRL